MTNETAVRLIADNLPALVHPGDGKPVAIPLPMFRNTGIPADQAEQFAQDAGLPHADVSTLVAESIVHLLETSGLPPTPTTQIEQLQVAAAANEHQRNRQVDIACSQCNGHLFTVDVEDFQTDRAKMRPQAIRAVQQLSAECAVGHGVA